MGTAVKRILILALYMPIRAEYIQLEPFQKLEQHTELRLLNQFQVMGENEYLTELSQDEDALEVEAFLQDAIALLPEQFTLPKGHIEKPEIGEQFDSAHEIISHMVDMNTESYIRKRPLSPIAIF